MSSATIIDLRSDAVSQPTDRMRHAMANAIVDHDVFAEDPTILELEDRCAKLFEKEAAIFVSSGTMGNLISLMVHCNEYGSEAIVGSLSHIYLYEQGGAENLAGITLTAIPNNENGTYSLDELRTRIRESDQYEACTKLAIVENTHNICGGKVIPLEWLDEFCKICRSHGLSTHMDGARIFHAAEYLNVPVARLVRDFDSITFCLNKSLSTLIGSVLIGSMKFIADARRVRKMLGGGMRQAGILAAAGLVALDEIVPKLGNDHRRMKKIAQAIYDLKSPFFTTTADQVQTNICMVEILQADKYPANYLIKRFIEIKNDELIAGIKDDKGNGIIVKACARDEWNGMRLVVYHQIDDILVDLAIKKIQFCINELK